MLERAALAQQLRGDADLADVVQHRGVLDVAQGGRVQPEHASDAAREVGDRERVARRVHVLCLERAHERVDRGEEARLELAGDALPVQREGGLQRHAPEQGQLGGAEGRAVQPQQAERADQRAVELHRHVGRQRGRGNCDPGGRPRSLADDTTVSPLASRSSATAERSRS